ncbi:MAG TPA: glutathione peroxidase [Xanthobacteraceae bacterium]|nr:glutathione peroxidase [Xanthobacteraceae bacterium]
MTTISRRLLLQLAALAAATPAVAQAGGQSRPTAYAYSFKTLDGGTIRLADYAGRPILIVNVASQCGFTPQYAGLKALQERFGEKLVVIGVPSNDFNQEPGGAEQILATAQGHYGISFPLAEKAVLRGTDAHPFYRWAAIERPLDVPNWNFHKYLVGRDGRLAAVFPTRVEPMDARVLHAIARELKSD